MTAPVLYDQTILAGDPSGRPGDCLRACVATLLQVSLDRVPHFLDSDDWQSALLAFRSGLWLINLKCDYWPPELDTKLPWVIGLGKSVRGVGHAVVLNAYDGSLAHDPHPSRAGLVGWPTHLVYAASWAR